MTFETRRIKQDSRRLVSFKKTDLKGKTTMVATKKGDKDTPFTTAFGNDVTSGWPAVENARSKKVNFPVRSAVPSCANSTVPSPAAVMWRMGALLHCDNFSG